MHWEEQILEAALGEGAQLVADEQPSFSMHWSSIREFWEVSCYGDAETEVTILEHAVCLYIDAVILASVRRFPVTVPRLQSCVP